MNTQVRPPRCRSVLQRISRIYYYYYYCYYYYYYYCYC